MPRPPSKGPFTKPSNGLSIKSNTPVPICLARLSGLPKKLNEPIILNN